MTSDLGVPLPHLVLFSILVTFSCKPLSLSPLRKLIHVSYLEFRDIVWKKLMTAYFKPGCVHLLGESSEILEYLNQCCLSVKWTVGSNDHSKYTRFNSRKCLQNVSHFVQALKCQCSNFHIRHGIHTPSTITPASTTVVTKLEIFSRVHVRFGWTYQNSSQTHLFFSCDIIWNVHIENTDNSHNFYTKAGSFLKFSVKFHRVNYSDKFLTGCW